VATLLGRPYYNITRALRQMDVRYESMSPSEAASSPARVIITTEPEARLIAENKDAKGGRNGSAWDGVFILDTELEQDELAVSKARILRGIAGTHAYYFNDQLTIGVDPGSRIGISVIYLHQEIASWVSSSTVDAINEVSVMVEGIDSKKKVLRIGDGDMQMARRIALNLKQRFGHNIHIEIVDEHGTSLPQNIDANRRGMRDRSSARNIAFRTGETFASY
jgi:hypothetical protein